MWSGIALRAARCLSDGTHLHHMVLKHTRSHAVVTYPITTIIATSSCRVRASQRLKIRSAKVRVDKHIGLPARPYGTFRVKTPRVARRHCCQLGRQVEPCDWMNELADPEPFILRARASTVLSMRITAKVT